jgi:hypothetical protein
VKKDGRGARARLFPSLYTKYDLLALSPLVPGTGKEFAVFMLAHFLSTFFNDASQWITSSRS